MSEAELCERLDRLERKQRRVMRVALVALALVAATVGMGATYYRTPEVPPKIVAREFDMIDGSGRARIKMDIGALGQPKISLLDVQGSTGRRSTL